MAPEVISRHGSSPSNSTDSGSELSYSCKSDCWSMGVLLYILLSGRQPFRRKASSLEVLKKAITSGGKKDWSTAPVCLI